MTVQGQRERITRPKGRVRIETPCSLTVSRLPSRRITRPKGRVRIETLYSKESGNVLGCITRPKGRVRIETSMA